MSLKALPNRSQITERPPVEKEAISRQRHVSVFLNRICRMLLLIGCLSFFPLLSAFAQSNSSSPLGTNLSGVSYYTSEQPFLNIFKTAGYWNTINSSGQGTGEQAALYQNFLDANGYPTRLPLGGAYATTQVSVVLLFGLPSAVSAPYAAGDYLLQWNGAASFTYAFDAAGTCSSSPCVIHVGSPNYGLKITLTSTGSGANHGTNFSLIYCGTFKGSNPTGSQCSATDNMGNAYVPDGQLATCQAGTLISCFNPSFINLTRPFKTLRFMDWMGTNASYQTDWSGRPTPNWVFWDDGFLFNNQSSGGYGQGPVPAEVMIALCNAINADCWFNMPLLATDDYVTQFATLAHSALNSNLKVYVEYGNEMWNQNFPASLSADVIALSNAAFTPPASSNYGAVFYYGLLRTVQDGAIWKSVWGSDSNRVIRVYGGQAAWAARNQEGLAWTSTYFQGTVAANVDALAIAPYFGYAVPDTFTLDQLFTEMTAGGLVSGGYPGGMIQQALSWVASNYTLAQSLGLALIGYEGGQTLEDGSGTDTALENLYAAANRDSRMGSAYITFFNGWKAAGGQMFNHYNDVSPQSKFGYWGSLDDVLQTSSSKYSALTAFISTTPCWWSGCATSSTSTPPPVTAPAAPPSVPTGLAGTVTATATATAAATAQISLTWTASTDNAGTVAGYNVFRNGAKVGTSTRASYQDTNLSAGTTYTYTVSSYDTAGNTSAQSSGISVSTPAPPKVTISSPSNGTVIKGNGDINIAASASDASGIQTITITADSKILHTCTGTTSCSTTWQRHNVSRGTHVVRVTAIGAFGLQSNASVTIVDLR